MKLSLSKYIKTALEWFALFALIEALLLMIHLADRLEIGAFLIITVAINGVCTLLPAGYYFVMYLDFKKKCMNYTPIEGVVSNWEAGFFQHTGRIIVNVDGKEYYTSAYFRHYEAKELVGKRISYAIIDETLFVYEVKV